MNILKKDDIEVNLKLPNDSSKKYKAIVTIKLFRYIKIKGFRVSESVKPNRHGEYLWVMTPSYFAGRGWHSIFFMEGRDK